jgi:hypothetical protein
MPSMRELHDKLDAISAKIEAAREKMEFKRGLNDGHNLTSGELMARYAFLKDTLDKEIAETEVHDHHVTALEQDAMNWINSIDLASS